MAFGSAGGLPTVPSGFAWYGGSDELTARAMMGRMRLCSFFRKALYLCKSLGLERLPWLLLGFLLFLLYVFQLLAPAQIGSHPPMEQEERERDAQPYHGAPIPHKTDRTAKEREDSATGKISFNRHPEGLRATPKEVIRLEIERGRGQGYDS